MKFERLLAKSRPKDLPADAPLPESALLPVHLSDVHRAAGQVLDCTGHEQLNALGLIDQSFRERLRRIVLLAAAVHDLGKANDHFQGMVQDDPNREGRPQGLRHEWISLLILEDQAVRGWLLPAAGDETDWQIMLWAVAGHHPAFNRESPPKSLVSGAGSQIEVLMAHSDFRSCLEWHALTFGLPAAPPTSSQKLSLAGAGNAREKFIIPWSIRSQILWNGFKESDRRLVAAVKACLIGGDVAGSALPREVSDEVERTRWIERAFGCVPLPGRVQRIVERRRGPNPLYPFQQQVADSKALVTYVRAGCGSGKTLAAYQWASTQHPGRRLYFCYPTTGTATEGYRDYLHNPEEEFDAELFHGRAAVDLEIVLGVKADDERAEADALARIESLDAWSTPIVACTVDTVLGLVQNNRRGLYAWPALAGAAYVFDEIHAYDDKPFGALLRFLQALPGVPVLLMTASLPTARHKALEALLAKRQQTLPMIPTEPLPSELWPRYHRQSPLDPRNPLPEIREELARGGKVLWVCNTVDRTIAAADSATDFKPKIYHSRFRYEDRVKRHKEVVAAFDPHTAGPVLACCTQVAEMSLDLKGVTLLVTEIAPVPPLIQRLGRENRQATRHSPTRPFIVIDLEPDQHLPYTPAELDAARQWLAALGTGPLSQNDLAKKWEEFDKDRRPASLAAAWLDGGPATQVLELREASPGITIMLCQDIAAVRCGRIHPVRVAIPMPPPPKPWKDQWRQWPVVKGLAVAPAEASAEPQDDP
jgi:CRISPR-associated endonuclease/helicase Cas3